jgi:asparagine synthase (glutamine-hydrolysing)
MCGIAGYFGKREIEPDKIDKCLALMYRRGPDSAAYRHFVNQSGRNTYLLHSRLSIIDLDPRSNQPFNIGPSWIVFNGELYNYIEVKQHLEQRSHKFFTTSDTEVLLATINEFGWQGLDRCEGMWAFCSYDTKSGSMLLSRDRFGEKPLYVYRDETGLYFGSEVKFIFALLGRALPVNFNHLYRYLVNGYKALYKVQETFFEGLEELPKASALSIDKNGTENLHNYWQPQYIPDENMSFTQAVDGVRESLMKAVRLRLRADVPMAFCMSGGIDSNSLISIAKRKFNYDVHGFTIVNTDERFDEWDVIEQSVKELGIRHTTIPVTTFNFLDDLRVLIKQHDAPVYTINYYSHWMLMKQVAEHGYRISVSGTAADELVSGYYDHHLQYLAEVYHTDLYPSALENWKQHIQPYIRNPFLKNPLLFIENPSMREHIFLDNDIYSSFMINDWREEFTETSFTDSLMRNRMMNEMFVEGVPVILHEDDLNAMYYSVENRSPFLDRELFEFCYRIPTRHLIRDAFTKILLREAMRDIVPDVVLWNHRKVGFNAPILSYLDTKNKSVLDELLAASPIYKYVRRDAMERMLKNDNFKDSDSKFIFNFVCAKIFLEEFGT